MLATTGTAKLTAEDDQHPNYITADDILSEVIEDFSALDLWFNVSTRDLAPNVDNKVVVPSNALTVNPTDPSKNYVIREGFLFDMDTYSFTITDTVECRITYELTVAEMPPVAIQFLRADARFRYFVNQDGASAKVQVYSQDLERKYNQLIITHMKNSDANFFSSQAYANFAVRRAATASPLTRIE